MKFLTINNIYFIRLFQQNKMKICAGFVELFVLHVFKIIFLVESIGGSKFSNHKLIDWISFSLSLILQIWKCTYNIEHICQRVYRYVKEQILNT